MTVAKRLRRRVALLAVGLSLLALWNCFYHPDLWTFAACLMLGFIPAVLLYRYALILRRDEALGNSDSSALRAQLSIASYVVGLGALLALYFVGLFGYWVYAISVPIEEHERLVRERGGREAQEVAEPQGR